LCRRTHSRHLRSDKLATIVRYLLDERVYVTVHHPAPFPVGQEVLSDEVLDQIDQEQWVASGPLVENRSEAGWEDLDRKPLIEILLNGSFTQPFQG
jgi:hypothetical protein